MTVRQDRLNRMITVARGVLEVPVPLRDARLWARRDEPDVPVTDARGRVWTAEDVRRFWRRAARTRARQEFARRGHTAETADDVLFTFDSLLRGNRVPHFPLAWDGAQEGVDQAWRRPGEPSPEVAHAEDATPTQASKDLAEQRAAAARVEAARRAYGPAPTLYTARHAVPPKDAA